jgi:uncharacterized protein (TIGR02246 family)
MLMSRQRLRGAVLAILLLAGILALGPAAARAQSVPQWLHDKEKNWLAAFNAGDAKALANLYAADAAVLIPAQSVRGRPSIDQFQASYLESNHFSCSASIDGARVLEKLAAVWGHVRCTKTPRGGGPAQTTTSDWLRIYELQPNGDWLISRDTSQPPNPDRR